jgi:hypothetical protein
LKTAPAMFAPALPDLEVGLWTDGLMNPKWTSSEIESCRSWYMEARG